MTQDIRSEDVLNDTDIERCDTEDRIIVLACKHCDRVLEELLPDVCKSTGQNDEISRVQESFKKLLESLLVKLAFSDGIVQPAEVRLLDRLDIGCELVNKVNESEEENLNSWSDFIDVKTRKLNIYLCENDILYEYAIDGFLKFFKSKKGVAERQLSEIGREIQIILSLMMLIDKEITQGEKKVFYEVCHDDFFERCRQKGFDVKDLAESKAICLASSES